MQSARAAKIAGAGFGCYYGLVPVPVFGHDTVRLLQEAMHFLKLNRKCTESARIVNIFNRFMQE